MPGQHDHRGAEADRRGARRQIGEQIQRGRDLPEPGEMMLNEEHARKAEFLGGDNVPDEIVVAFAVPRRAAARPRAAEQSEFHAILLDAAGTPLGRRWPNTVGRRPRAVPCQAWSTPSDAE